LARPSFALLNSNSLQLIVFVAVAIPLENLLSIGAGVFDVTHTQVTHGVGATLNKGTAWLYHQFKIGQLQSYNYGAGRTTTAAALQNEIWCLMGQTAVPDPTFDPIVNEAALIGLWNPSDPSAGW
jgi:hypothetical protein